MQLYSLDSNYMLGNLIENWDSLIWNERYRDSGDFVLTTPDINNTRGALPLQSLVSLLDTKEIMWVENHTIKIGEDGTRTLEVSGRSFETFFENRVTAPSSPATRPDFQIAIPGTTDTNAVTLSSATSSVAALFALGMFENSGYYIYSNDAIPLHTFLNSVPQAGLSTGSRFIERGSAYDVAIKLLEENDDGIRNERPGAVGNDIITRLYHGTDRTTSVVLDVRAGHFENVTYFWSVKDFRNLVYVASQKDSNQAGSSPLSGLSRRVTLLDLPEITQTGAALPYMLFTKGEAYRRKHNPVTLFDGTLSETAPFKYGTDYFLGDTIKCLGEYYLSLNMKVSEYIRVEDENGETAYPTLSV